MQYKVGKYFKRRVKFVQYFIYVLQSQKKHKGEVQLFI